MRSLRYLIGAAALLNCLVAAPSGAAQYPPSIEWRTLETTHFFIHYNAENEAQARRLAAMVEPIHQRLSVSLQWTPEDKTHVILSDHVDVSNGSATPAPRNTIEIYLTPPPPSSVLGDQDDWLRLVFTHEYVHILHLDQAYGPSKITRDLLGRNLIGAVNQFLPIPFLPFPNLFLPLWMTEGFATLDESVHTTAGRGHSSYADMVLRMAAIDDRFFPLDKGSGMEGEWPGGAFRYLYGEAFLEYLADKHGREKVNRMYEAHSWGLTPFAPTLAAAYAMGSPLEVEWWAWQEELRREALRTRRELRKTGLTAVKPMSKERWETRHPRRGPDGETVYYTVQNNYSYPHVKALNLRTGADEWLFEQNFGGGAAAPSADGRHLYFTQLEFHKKFSLVGDVYRFDLTKRQTERLTRGARLLSVDIAPNHLHLVAVQNDLNEQRLVLYTLEGKAMEEVRVLASGENRIFDTPRFSADGQYVTYASWTPGGFADIYVADLEGREWRLTHDRHVDVGPVFTDDGQHILFSSDRTGIYNLFQIPFSPEDPGLAGADGPEDEAPRPIQVTNVLGGVFESEPLAGDRVLAAAYGGDGFYIGRLAARPITAPAMAWKPDRLAYESPYPATFTGSAQPYRPSASLWPQAWSPILRATSGLGLEESFGEVGFSLAGRDVLGFHQYELEARYHTALNRPSAALRYAYDRLTPSLFFALEDVSILGRLSEPAPGDGSLAGIRSQGVGAALSYPFPGLRRSHLVSLQYTLVRDREFGHIPSEARVENRTGAALFNYAYGSAKQYPIGISPQDGSRFGLTSQVISPVLGADARGAAAVADLRHYWGLPYRQVIALQGQAGIAATSRPIGPFRLGGNSPRQTLGDVGVFPLRGFLESDPQVGTRIAKVSAEYRLPLGLIKRGIPFLGSFPFLADQFHMAFFAEAGSAWDDRPEIRASAGSELIFDFTVGYFIPISAGIGLAFPLAPAAEKGPPLIYLVLAGYNF